MNLIIILIVFLLHFQIAIQVKRDGNLQTRSFYVLSLFCCNKNFAIATLALILMSGIFEEILKYMTSKLYCNWIMNQNHCF
jgi:hypothetical protein